jgi:hypothetical protein
MSSPLFPWSLPRARRHVAWLVAAAIMLAGIAQAAHYHKAEIARGTTDVHCLLCLFAGSSAGPPAIPQALPGAVRYCSYRFPADSLCPPAHHPAPYQARGPPLG